MNGFEGGHDMGSPHRVGGRTSFHAHGSASSLHSTTRVASKGTELVFVRGCRGFSPKWTAFVGTRGRGRLFGPTSTVDPVPMFVRRRWETFGLQFILCVTRPIRPAIDPFRGVFWIDWNALFFEEISWVGCGAVEFGVRRHFPSRLDLDHSFLCSIPSFP